MTSKITIQFTAPVHSGDILQIQDSNTPSVLIDLQYGTTGLSMPVTGNIDSDITNTVNRLENGYNSTNRYTITADYVNDTIEILDNIGSSTFSVTQNNTIGRLGTTIENGTVITDIKITDVTISENATNPCSLVDITITTNQQATNITSPVNQTVSTNPFTITGISRDSINDITITVNDANTSATKNVYVPLLNSSYFEAQVVQNPSSNTVNILNNYSKTPLFGLTYSLDNVNFYSSSSFSGLADGDYTAYIKDSIGCSANFAFEITAFEPNVYVREAIFEVSAQNSLITVKDEVIDDITTFRNATNTLSYEECTEVNNRSFKQVYQKKDGIITQQYRTSYTNVTIKLIDCNNNESILVSTKKTDNFNQTDVRDVSINEFTYNNSQFVGVQYVTGNIYNPDTLAVEKQYNLGTQVPDFMNIDDYIQIEGAGWYRVRDIVYYNQVETLILDSLVSSFPITPTGQTLKGTAIYNILPYDLFEFSFDCNTLDGDYYITYEATDGEFDTVKEKTEWFNVADVQLNTYLLQYYNTENNETNYSTGIVNKIRIPYTKTLEYSPSDTQDVYLTDTNAVSIEATYRDFYTLNVFPVPMGMIRKIGLAVSNDRLFLNGLSLLKNAELESERVGVSNLYRLTVQFIRSDYAFSNIASDGSIILPSGEPLQVNDNAQGLLFIN